MHGLTSLHWGKDFDGITCVEDLISARQSRHKCAIDGSGDFGTAKPFGHKQFGQCGDLRIN